jgi:hypothetical protein
VLSAADAKPVGAGTLVDTDTGALRSLSPAKLTVPTTYEYSLPAERPSSDALVTALLRRSTTRLSMIIESALSKKWSITESDTAWEPKISSRACVTRSYTLYPLTAEPVVTTGADHSNVILLDV